MNLGQRKIHSWRASATLLLCTIARFLGTVLSDRVSDGIVTGSVASPGSTASTLGRHIAILIGIDEYTSYARLNGCALEVRELEKALRERVFQTRPLLNSAATRQAILSTLHEIRAGRGKNDLVWFHFAGHVNREHGRSAIVCYDTGDDPVELEDIIFPQRDDINLLLTGAAVPISYDDPPTGVAATLVIHSMNPHKIHPRRRKNQSASW